MADGDLNAVFRPAYDPDLYHRRRYSAAGTAPAPPAAKPFERAPRLKPDEPLHTAFTQRQRRHFAPIARARSFTRQDRQTPPGFDHVGLIHFIRANRGSFPILPYDGPHDRARRVPLPTFDQHFAFRARHLRHIASFGNGPAATTQVVRLTIGAGSPEAQTTQVVRLLVGTREPPLGTVQIARLVVGRSVECVTAWQQLWRIKRTDGVIFRFTSLDEAYSWGDEVFKSCASLMPSASEESSKVGSVGSIELTGIIADDGITEEELYGGKFDDAFVEVWLKSFDGKEVPRRLAAGWTGNLSHGEQGFSMEVTGPGAKLDQQAITTIIAPSCRWVFGDSRCTKDLEALKTSGQVTVAGNRGAFLCDAPDPANGSQWQNGKVRWLTGRNAGAICETKTVDYGADTSIVLWALTPYLPQAGDTFDLLPGCDLSADTCETVYSNLINFGGFRDVPGNDAIAQTPDSKV